MLVSLMNLHEFDLDKTKSHASYYFNLPTADEEMKTLGGFAASAIFLANVFVVSMRLCLKSCINSLFHLFKQNKAKRKGMKRKE